MPKNNNKQNNNGKLSVAAGGMMKNTSRTTTNMHTREQAAVAVQHKERMTKPKMTYRADGSTHVEHREFIADITSSVAFQAFSLTVNPGDETTFPWLYAIARRYESYLFDNLQFEFETTSPTSERGTIIITLDYDAADAAPTSKTQALAYSNAVRSAPWQDCAHKSSLSDLRKRKTYYVQSGSSDPNDAVDYDVARCFVCKQGQLLGGVAIGELYVRYGLTLMTPQLNSSDVQSGAYVGSLGSLAIPLGANPNIDSTVPVSYDGLSGEFTFNAPWQGLLIISTAGDPGVITLFGNVTFVGAPIVTGSAPNFTQINKISAVRGQRFNFTTTIIPSISVLRFSEYLTAQP
nr:structural protein [Tolivirales sp.]